MVDLSEFNNQAREDRLKRFSEKLAQTKFPGPDEIVAREMAKEIALAESEGRPPFEGKDLETAKAELDEQYAWMKIPMPAEDRAFLEALASNPNLLAEAFVTREFTPEERALEF